MRLRASRPQLKRDPLGARVENLCQTLERDPGPRALTTERSWPHATCPSNMPHSSSRCCPARARHPAAFAQPRYDPLRCLRGPRRPHAGLGLRSARRVQWKADPLRHWQQRGCLRQECPRLRGRSANRSEEHTSELQSLAYLVCRLLLEKKKKNIIDTTTYT